ncbi:MAG: iron ABC transporter permease [Melioribacter sp.]|nr:iron ABC transporter permease [Melioribacter sp.]
METTSRLTITTFILWIVVLSLILFVVVLICLSIGSIYISPLQIISLALSNQEDYLTQIIFDIRLPRVLYAVLVGGGLSIAGAVFQSLLLNPLAEPYILGISSGGTFGAILSFILGLTFPTTQFFAFLGSLFVMIIVFALGKRFGELEPNILLLSGIMVGAFFSALILLMMSLLNDSLRTTVYWLIGNLSIADKRNLVFVAPVIIIVTTVLIVSSNKFNIMSLGIEHAKQLGVNTKLLRNTSYILTSLMVGTIVSISGIIGFVGLLIPHICRMLLGNDNRLVFMSSFFIGASYLAIADTIARIIIAPSELPVGAITAIIGAPIFIYLLKKRFNTIN